jgi:uncharacterized protein YegJ (DUF2314 family)
MKTPFLLLSFVLALTVFGTGCSKKTSSDRVIDVKDDDPDMVAAIGKGRATLPEFWKKFEHPDPNESDFNLKVRIKDQYGTEYFWLNNLEKHNNVTSGVINNEPEIVKCVKLGQRIPIPEEDIADWLYMRRGKIVGNYTVRALFKTMSPEEVKECKRMMETP